MTDANFIHSTLRERIVEHLLVGEVLRALWCRGITDVEVLRSEFDAHGYDIVLARGPIVRHVQLKTQAGGDVGISVALAQKPSGCLIWIKIDSALNLGPYWWFGGRPGEPLPALDSFKILRRTTPNRDGIKPERPNHRKIPKAAFDMVSDIDGVLAKLFGPLPS
jgi:hypothetical protein